MAKAVYIHIPFCRSICSYCDFCKFYYNKKWVKDYLRALRAEVAAKYKGEEITSLYIGGGTPSALDISELKELFNIISSFKVGPEANFEFTIECNSEDLNVDKLKLFKKSGVNRLSIGVQTFNESLLEKLNRKLNLDNIKLAFDYFSNISFDLMYALPGETIEDLKSDVEMAISLNPSHISVYALIIEPNTALYISGVEEIDDSLQRDMYDYVCSTLGNNSARYNHYEISNFARKGCESQHNLVYWNNEEYYGFGLGASGYLDGIRYDNTKSINKYSDFWTSSGGGNVSPIICSEKIDLNRKLEDEFMLGLRKVPGINKKRFYEKYRFETTDIDLVSLLIEKGELVESETHVMINPKYIYVSNGIIEKFIDTDLLIH